MSETARLWTETSFNIVYLLVIWWLVISMWQRREFVAQRDLRTADLIMWAFAFLGFGDIGHVGFRVVAFAMGGLDVPVTIFGKQLLLAPLGSLATAITFTFFYVLMIMAWRARYHKPYGALGYFLFALAVMRLLIMMHPDNGWQSLQAVQPWSCIAICRSCSYSWGLPISCCAILWPRMIAPSPGSGLWYVVSFICYAPVIFFQQQVPQIGMLMIPKTLAYLVMAFLALFEFYKVKAVSGLKTTTVTP